MQIIYMLCLLIFPINCFAYDALTSYHYDTFRRGTQYYIQRVDSYHQVTRSLKGTVITRTNRVYFPIYPTQRSVIGKNHYRIYP